MLELKIGAANAGMGWMEFVSSLVGSLAWPVAAVIIAAIFHKQIAGLLAKIRKLNWGEASVELAEQLDKVEDKARVAEAEAEIPALPEPIPVVPDDRFQSLLTISPSAAILDAWKPVERRLTDLGKQHYGNELKYSVSHKVAERLAADGHLMSSVVSMVGDMRKIRNEAAHIKEVSVTDALRFQELATQVMSLLSRS
ncbi:hypothetical protein [Novosphingobium capsulatum]|uniref:hypothetical protein n=1 Tax=Novosphingobium capsulatum TaxID=13688 RepID=UPI0012EE0A51|nr:hypothetical protein [Novosphingobium capsulatum]WQD91388.1 hypothetical protein U0041_10170 [Novosphingobium capsulatum]